MVKYYVSAWALGILAAAVVYLTGNLTPVVAVFFGFMTFGAVFLGMLSVLPSFVEHHLPRKH